MVKRISLALVAALTLATVSFAQTWDIDPAHSQIGFSVKHLVISNVSGKFTDFDGKIVFDGKDLAAGSAEFTVQSKSITTENEKRDNHLRSSDFFAVDSFPTLTFKSTQIVPGPNNSFKMTGDLSIRGVTKPVTFDCAYNGSVEAFGGTRASFSASATINRQDFGVSWSKTLDNGGLVVSNDVKISIELEIVKAKA
ncbi:MAG: YceI family protein [Candidatus Zixiibacteriota bacterium]